MLRGLTILISALFIVACDAGLDSNVDDDTSRQSELVDKINKATLQEIKTLNLLGEYHIDLISKEIDPALKKKFKFSRKVDIIAYPEKATVNARQLPLYTVKAIVTYVPPEDGELSPRQFPTLLANVYFSAQTKEIVILFGPEGGSPMGGGMSEGPLFLAIGSIESEGFKMNKIFTTLGEFEPAFMYRLDPQD